MKNTRKQLKNALSKRAGFTLIAPLVVVATSSGLLIGLLLPAVQK